MVVLMVKPNNKISIPTVYVSFQVDGTSAED